MYLGIDIGSISTNAVLVDGTGNILTFVISDSGYDHKHTIQKTIQTACQSIGIPDSDIKRTVSTGYGRNNVAKADKTVTEITCHAVGVHRLFPKASVILDIGGQDSKVIRLNKEGHVESFSMNDKCSAGTGRFLEVMARLMKMDLDEFARCGITAKHIYPISSTCTVFAESEVISGIAGGTPKEEIIAGIYCSIAKRVLSLAGTIQEDQEIVLTGGVAKNMGIRFFIKQKFPNLKTPFEPQITGAYGAALLALYDE